MNIALAFSQDENQTSKVSMSIDGAEPVSFDYVKFVKHLIDNSGSKIDVICDSCFSDEQKKQIESMVAKISDAVTGSIQQSDEPASEDKVG